MTTPSGSSKWVAGLLLAWLVATGSGFFALGAYQFRPGRSGAASAFRAELDGIRLDPVRPTLLMFLHPLCPCSRASVNELVSLASRDGGRFATHAILYRPEGTVEGWDGSDIGGLNEAAIPGLRRWNDPGGHLSRRFGVETSGHVLLFDPSGRLLFSGGITASRGHRGVNPGLDALTARIGGSPATGTSRSPVFGCPILDLESEPGVEMPR